MMIDIKQALKAAVEQDVSGGCLGRREFIDQLAKLLKKKYRLDVKVDFDKNGLFLECEMGKDKTPGFRINFESRSMAVLTPNKFSVSSHAESFGMSGDKVFNMLAEEEGQEKVVAAVGKWLVENSKAELLNRVVHNRQKAKVLAL